MSYEHVCLASGGVDSSYLLAAHRQDFETGLALFVDYGQPAAAMEEKSARMLAKCCMWDFAKVTVRGMPLGQMGDGVGAHVVPARNLWLVSLAAAFGRNVWIGCGPQDERDYEDCRLGFLGAFDATLGTLGKRLRWSQVDRASRLALLERHDFLAYTWSCYGVGPEPCGECASCLQ